MAKEENTTPMELPHACHAYRVTSSCVKEDVARNYINQFKLEGLKGLKIHKSLGKIYLILQSLWWIGIRGMRQNL